jgi:hypothetical protein
MAKGSIKMIENPAYHSSGGYFGPCKICGEKLEENKKIAKLQTKGWLSENHFFCSNNCAKEYANKKNIEIVD